MDALARQVARGDRAVVLWVIQMTGIERFALARDIDPVFADAVARARAAGVEALAYACDMSVAGVSIGHRVPFASKRPSRNCTIGWMARLRCDSKRLSKPVWRASCGPRPPGGSIAAINCVMEAT